ncbi:hypothetical protein CF319_g8768 [Tilletia indica]|nr:hypothetical protein CF319_g8768 [Tilletia indica]
MYIQNPCLSIGIGAALNISEFRQLIEAVAHKHFRTGYLREATKMLFPAESSEQDGGEDLDDVDVLGMEGCGEDGEDFLDVAADFMEGLRGGRDAQQGVRQDPFSAQSGRSDEASWVYYARQKAHRAGMDDGVITNSRIASRMYQAFFGLLLPRVGGTLSTVRPGIKQAVKTNDVIPALGMSSSNVQGVIPPLLHTAAAPASGQMPSVASTTNIRARTAMLSTTRPPLGSLDGLQGRFALSPTILKAVMGLTGGGSGPRRPLPLPISDGLALLERSLASFACIVKTNGGKSLLWQAEALVSRRGFPSFALLVVPYLSLIDDIKRVGREKGIACADWNPTLSINPNTEVVVVSLAKAVKGPFLQWLADAEIQAALRRVFVDEAHVLVDEEFRKGIEDFGKLTERLPAKQFVYLSATIPPSCEERLEKIACMPVRFLREGTSRDNLAYSLVNVANEREAVEHVRDSISRVTNDTIPAGQVLIICRDKRTVKQVAKELNCGYYFSNNDASESEIEAMDDAMEEFKTGLKSVLVGTSAASTGIDFDRVGLVALLDGMYSMAAGMQAAGRAGRRGFRAEVHIYKVKNSRYPPNHLPEGPHPRTDDEAVGLLMAGERCMREPISHWLDGRVISCIELGGEWCSVCEEMYDKPSAPATSTPVNHVRQGKRQLNVLPDAPPADKRQKLIPSTSTPHSSARVFSPISSPFSNESTLVRRVRPFTSALEDKQDWSSEPSSSGSSSSSGALWDSPSAKNRLPTATKLAPIPNREPTTNSPRPSGTFAAREVGALYSHKAAFTTWAALKNSFLQSLRLVNKYCAMCYMVERDFYHKSSHCTLKDCNMSAQKTFREKGRNDWPNGRACWGCSLPMTVCNERLGGGTCELSAHRDMIRGILLLLTLHEGVRTEAVKFAQRFDKDYDLPRPQAPGIMGDGWTTVFLLRGATKVYQAFPAVMAVVLMLAKNFE